MRRSVSTDLSSSPSEFFEKNLRRTSVFSKYVPLHVRVSSYYVGERALKGFLKIRVSGLSTLIVTRNASSREHQETPATEGGNHDGEISVFRRRAIPASFQQRLLDSLQSS
jgi:hypothetical protein